MVPASSLIAWGDAPSFRNVAPVILSGHLGSRLCKVLSISVEEGHGESDDGVVTVRHFEVQADEAIASVIMEAADLNGVGSLRGDDSFGHSSSFRANQSGRTIAEGGAVQDQVLNICDRVPGGQA